jgi:parvulin-like peptidyl-prolyl isomerase
MRRTPAALCAVLLGAAALAGCGGSSGSGSSVPNGVVAVVDGNNITVSELETTMHIAKLSMKTAYPEPGTTEWISLRARALESLAHDAELRAWARNLGVSVSQAKVDEVLEQTLASAFPVSTSGGTTGKVDQKKVDAEFRRTGMTRALLRHRIETKLLAQAAAKKVGGSPSVSEAQVLAQYDKDKSTTYALPERRKLRHILVKDKALADTLYTQLSSSDAQFATLAKKYSTDSSKASGGELGVLNRTSLVKAFADVAFTVRTGVVTQPVKTQFGWHLIEAEGPVMPASTRPLDAALKQQIRTQLAEKARQKRIAQQFNAAEIELARDIRFAPGYAPPVAAAQ